jgi:hypothetical protein
MNDEAGNQQAPESTGPSQTVENETAPPVPNEMDMLKSRARLMGLTFSNNIGIEALREKIREKLAGDANKAAEETQVEQVQQPAQTTETAPILNPLAGDEAGQVPASKKSKRQAMIDEQMKLVRVRIQNMDPKKRDLPGEIFCVGNEILGTIRKYIPYGEATENGYHIPYILYNELNSRRFQNIKTTRKNGQITVETNWAKEFALEILPPLTQEDLDRLATAQTAAGSVNNDQL